jgi:hypothetical protein
MTDSFISTSSHGGVAVLRDPRWILRGDRGF